MTQLQVRINVLAVMKLVLPVLQVPKALRMKSMITNKMSIFTPDKLSGPSR